MMNVPGTILASPLAASGSAHTFTNSLAFYAREIEQRKEDTARRTQLKNRSLNKMLIVEAGGYNALKRDQSRLFWRLIIPATWCSVRECGTVRSRRTPEGAFSPQRETTCRFLACRGRN
jgi:hypothetical protein